MINYIENIIREAEDIARSLGCFNPDGSVDFDECIRVLEAQNGV